jgi:predicted Rossmann fold nucleotide-binding protein DprA/Smf involved in DNA uptake
MFMSEQEIVTRYRQAKSKSQQITILSQINQCDRGDIIELLRLNGEYYKKTSMSQRWTEAECMRLEKMLDSDMTTREIAAVYGFKPAVMSSTVTYLRAQGRLQRREDARRRPRKSKMGISA